MNEFWKKPEVLEGTPKGGEPGEKEKKVDRFDKAIRYVMENETGKKWDKDDGSYTHNPGGHSDPPTKWGVILEEYQNFFGGQWTPEMVKAATREQALQVLRKKFWIPIKGDSYKSEAAATAILDTAVNKGLAGCKIILEDALKRDFGGEAWQYQEDLVSAVNSISQGDFLKAISEATLRYIVRRIERFPNMEWARAGWNNRARRLITLGAQ